MSSTKVENPVEDAKKLAQRCKALEAQLRQTITKKEHHEIVLEFEDKITAMEKTVSSQDRRIADQEKELFRTRAELQRNAGLGKQIADVGAQLAAVAKSAEAQSKTVDSLLFKVSQGTVPAAVHQQSLSRIKELDERVSSMVGRAEYASIQRRYEETARQLSGTVPAADYDALKGKVQELEGAVSSMVPREQLEASQATVRELRSKLSEHVPQSTYDELVSKVVQLAEDVTGGQTFTEDADEEQAGPAEPEEPSPSEPTPGVQSDVPAVPIPIPIHVEAQADSNPASPSKPSVEPPEIREVGTQLAELGTEVLAAKPDHAGDSTKAGTTQEPQANKPEGSELTLVVTSAPDPQEGEASENPEH